MTTYYPVQDGWIPINVPQIPMNNIPCVPMCVDRQETAMIVCLVQNGKYFAFMDILVQKFFPQCTLRDFEYVFKNVFLLKTKCMTSKEKRIFDNSTGYRSSPKREMINMETFVEYIPRLNYVFKRTTDNCWIKKPWKILVHKKINKHCWMHETNSVCKIILDVL
jgi:hypothetical protein